MKVGAQFRRTNPHHLAVACLAQPCPTSSPLHSSTHRRVHSTALPHASPPCTPPPADVHYDGGDKAGGAAAVGAAQVGPPLDEEAVGKAGAPERTGVPRDPENARSKKRSYTAVLVAGFALAIDFTMSLMSIQVGLGWGLMWGWGG